MIPYLEEHEELLFDGAFGTYYASLYDTEEACELANINHPERVFHIHKEYIEAGANAIRCNTFSANEQQLECNQEMIHEIIKQGYRIACQVAKEYGTMVFADIGPIVEQRNISLFSQYQEFVDVFLNEGAQNFLFETLSSHKAIAEISAYIKSQCPCAIVMVSFAVTADGYTRQGIPLRTMISDCECNPHIDAFGLNCVCGPMHMNRLLDEFDLSQHTITIMPNAGYPTVLANRTYFHDNSDYFAQEMAKIRAHGAKILGGCCGTTPAFIKKIKQALITLDDRNPVVQTEVSEVRVKKDHNPLRKKLQKQQSIIAVELDPPANCDIERFMYNAQFLREQGIDAITIADCPIARARADSSLLACKLHRELDMNIIPHMTCRDRNINATKALLYGLSIEGIQNVLVVTGDPIPAEDRTEVKGVFNFNSQILAGYIQNLNRSVFPNPFMVFGALNINAVNFKMELIKAKKKIEQGVEGFLTQPVLSKRALENMKEAYKTLDAYILGGIMPIVSHRNAVFMDNEISGIDVDPHYISLYEGKTREEAAQLAVSISCDIVKELQPYVHGYYLITPFNRVEIIGEIVSYIQQLDKVCA